MSGESTIGLGGRRRWWPVGSAHVDTLDLVDGDDEQPDPSHGVPARLLAGLNDAQRGAVRAEAPVLRILAGAGSGKTRVLTRRIALRVATEEVDPRRVLAVTFTRKAASELRSRLTSLLPHSAVTAGTFHSIAYAQLRQRWDERSVAPPELLDRKVGFVARLMRTGGSTAPLDAVTEIEWAKARMISAGDYEAAARRADRTSSIPAAEIAKIFEKYEKAKLEARMVDFDDLLRLACRDIRNDPSYAAARRWRFRHIFVDEFQDVNPLQFELLSAWVGDDPDLCVVGDPNQAIYSWNGADARYLTDLPDLFDRVETVELRENYRSSPQILGVANAVLSQTRAARFDLVPNRPDGPLPDISAHPTDADEAHAVTRALRDSHAPGSRWADHAVLVRTNAQVSVFEEALTAAGIPHRSRGGSSLLAQPEIRDVVARLRRGGGSLGTVLNDIQVSIDGGTDDSGEQLTDDRRATLGEFVRLGREFLAFDPEGSPTAFVGWVTKLLGADVGHSGRDAVDLATFHAAKGLEWSIVHLCGLEEGLVPISFARSGEALEEEHRLIYVAMTRAREELHLSWCEQRTFGDRKASRTRSPYLETVQFAIDMLATDTSLSDMSERIAEERERRSAAAPTRSKRATRTKATPDDLDDEGRELFAALRAWRVEQARAADVPAFVIFNDATLIEVCRERPTDNRGLLSISGIGPIKAQQWGDDVLRIVRDTG